MCTHRTWTNSILRPSERQNIILKYAWNKRSCNVQVWTKIGEKGGLTEAGGLFAQVERRGQRWAQRHQGWKKPAWVPGKRAWWLVMCVWINTNWGNKEPKQLDTDSGLSPQFWGQGLIYRSVIWGCKSVTEAQIGKGQAEERLKQEGGWWLRQRCIHSGAQK